MVDVGIIRNPFLKRAFFASWIYEGIVYIHGGVTKVNSGEKPLSEVVEVDLRSCKVSRVCCKNPGPKRSHHKCVVLESKWACLIGGWDGKQRTTEVWVLNMDDLEWTCLTLDNSCDPPAGLSSHTCTKVKSNEIIVSGREGGVRMQRRYASVFCLKVDVKSKTYSFEEMPLHISSRSGHIACLIEDDSKRKAKSVLVVHGGRDSDSIELLGSYDTESLEFSADQMSLNTILKSIFQLKKSSSSTKPSFSVTKSRNLRHHAAIEAGKYCIVHGGEVFGKARDTVSGDLFAVDMIANKWLISSSLFMKGDPIYLKRMGHAIFYLHNKLYILAGIGSNGKIADDSILSFTL